MGLVSETLEKFTAANSGFETARDYISISHCYEPVDRIVQKFIDGFEDSHMIRLRCYKGYQMERDLVGRIMKCFPKEASTDYEEITAFGGLVKGHPDLIFNGYWADCKAVPLDEHLPFSTPEKRLPSRVYWQMQGYMRYGGGEKALLIYESRESGIIRDYWVKASKGVQDAIHDKLTKVVQIVNKTLSKASRLDGYEKI